MNIQLRPYQQDIITDLRAAFARGRKAPLVVSPTGSGKTYTYSAISHGAAQKGTRVLILEHRKELLRQASCSLAALDTPHQIVAPADKIADIRRVHVERFGRPWINRESHVAVASVQTLIRRLAWLREFDPDLIIIDEGDLAIATSWAKIIAEVPRAKLAGFTASPCRTDGRGMDEVYDDLIMGPSVADLIDMGALCRPRIFAPPVKADTSGVGRKNGDLDPQQLAALFDNDEITGDTVKHYRKLAPGRPAIVFCASVKHAEHVAAAFRADGWRFEVVTGTMPDDDRDDRIFGLASGRYHGIVTVDVVSRGTDIPVAEVAILIRKTESLALYLQQVGRVLRPAEGKEYGLILDHCGNTLIHGMPQADREWTLEGQARRGNGRAAEPTIRILQCPKCYHVHEPSPLCPQCGHQYDARSLIPKENDGELVEYQESEEEIERRQLRREQGRAQTVEQMVKQLGYSRARAQHILQAREEKQRLQSEATDLLVKWQTANGVSAVRRFGVTRADVAKMKPKELRELIAKVSDALFMGMTG